MKKPMYSLALIALALVAAGCALTDYDGHAGHKTSAEAKLFGQEISFSGFGEDFDGTYSYTVKYDHRLGRGNVTISSYRNPVVSSFSRDGVVDRDGDDVQGHSGDAGGTFATRFVAVDSAPGCQFDANLTQDKSALGPGVFACNTGALEEIDDRDFSLNASFSGLDDLIGQILSGSLSGSFDLELTSLSINGVSHPVGPVVIGAQTAVTRPTGFVIENQPGVASLIQTLLDNTGHMQPVSLGLGFNGGLAVNLPTRFQVAFDHDVLIGLL